jgi:hypothetical protein
MWLVGGVSPSIKIFFAIFSAIFSSCFWVFFSKTLSLSVLKPAVMSLPHHCCFGCAGSKAGSNMMRFLNR